ncbi:MAG: glycosyltransferase family 39 protein, partial [Phycisphaerae bacterium]|nr:glycosyltransferase family 39 protein [Phycisphaerae bacterium]
MQHDVESPGKLFGLALLILLLALVAGAGLRIAAVIPKKTITHDEGISYLAATGHQGDYARLSSGVFPHGQWVGGADWKRFLAIEDPLPLRRIGSDLANFDIHPPLYFWALHLWSLLFGVSLWAGLSLNILISLLAVLAVFSLARYVLQGAREGALAALLWAVSPAVLQVTAGEARPYELLALCTVLFASQFFRSTDIAQQPRWRHHLFLAAATAAGLLTHYHFAIVVAGCVGWACWRLVRRHRRRLVVSLASVAAGCVLFLVLHPHFWRAFLRAEAQAQDFQWSRLLYRALRSGGTLSGFMTNAGAGRLAMLLGLLGIGALVLMGFLRGRRHPPAKHNARRDRLLQVVFLLVWIYGLITALYL